MVSSVLGSRFGNHVGDWEHTMVRFIDGVPDTVYYSAHSGGAAYKYSAVEKIDVRPVSYTGVGTHANYAVCLSVCLNCSNTVSSLIAGAPRHRAIIQSALHRTRRTRDSYGTSLRTSEVSGTIHQAVRSRSRPAPDLEVSFSLQRAPVGSISVASGVTRSRRSRSPGSAASSTSVLFPMVQVVSTSLVSMVSANLPILTPFTR